MEDGPDQETPLQEGWYYSDDAAAYVGKAATTWRSYVSKGLAPKPDDPGDMRQHPKRRRPRWRAETLDGYKTGIPCTPGEVWAKRKGQGRRTDLHRRKAEQQALNEADLAAPAPALTANLQDWLVANHRAILLVAERLTDVRDDLLDEAPPEYQERLVEALDRTGELMSGRPSRGLASAVAYALFLLGPDGVVKPSDPELAGFLAYHQRLHRQYNELRSSGWDST
jgi:hypothetical protein